MFKKTRIFLCVFIIIFISLVGFSSLGSAQTSVAMLDSFYTDENMIMDGVLSENEYDLDLTTTFTIYDYNDQMNQKEMYMYSSYNDTHLFIGISIDDTDDSPFVIITFRINDSVDYFYDNSSSQFAFGNDGKGVSSTNLTYDVLTNTFFSLDTDFGGTADIEGACWTRGDGYEFEMQFPLDSGDIIGKDISLEVNDEIEFFIFYESDGEYTQIKTTDVEEEYSTLFLAPPSKDIPSYSTVLVIVSVLGVSSLLVIKNRHK